MKGIKGVSKDTGYFVSLLPSSPHFFRRSRCRSVHS